MPPTPLQADNLLKDIPAELPEELFRTLLATPSVRIERVLSRGQASPEGFWYDQDEAEWVVVLAGAARLRMEGDEPLGMTAGTFINIPAHRRHRVEWTHPTEVTVWLGVFYANE